MAFIASALVDPVCERVIKAAFDAAFEEAKLVRNVKKELEKLRLTASNIRGVLQDAEEKQVKNEFVRNWHRSLKQVLYDAEDILDEAATNSTLPTIGVDDARSVTGMRAKVRNIICCFGGAEKILRKHGLAHQIKDIRLKLDDMYKEKDGLGLQLLLTGNSQTVPSRSRRPPTSSLLADESCIIGRDDEKKKIIQKLLGSEDGSEPTISNNNVHVLALVGMGGVGKTTLASLVYNDDTVKQYFQLRIWVCVSEDFDLTRITKEIMDAIPSSTEQKEFPEKVWNWDLAQKRLKDTIEGKRFLLILDDVWEVDSSKWESLYEPFKYGGKGSKVMITTRNQGVVNMVKEALPIPLKNLSSEELWSVFKRYAFDGHDSNKHMQLETVGRQIVDKLKGSPLAATTIGQLLNKDLDARYWKNILKSEIFKLEQDSENISPVLKLSYDHLPGHLKQCFAYCSLFPKDYNFSKDELTQHWTAQQFIQTSRWSRAEIIQSAYFDDLLDMSFFEQSTSSTYYVMHDLIHDLAESVSEDDYFRLEDDRPVEFRNTVRHLSVAIDNIDPTKLKELCTHENLRTLIFLRRCKFELSHHLDDLFMKLKRLRMLGLENCKIFELPSSIGTLKHLRFVNLSYTPIRKLPESFCCLHKLQVLKIQGCRQLGALPRNMSKLVNLTHLEGGQIGAWPSDMRKLVSDIQGLGKLTALQELNVSGGKARELGDMGMLRVLEIFELEQVASKEEAMQARLDVKENLEELDLSWNYCVEPTLAEEVLDGLRPVDSIRKLIVCFYGGVRSPMWLTDRSWISSSFLETVELSFCTNWEVLPPLGQLCCLKILRITGMDRVRQIGHPFFGCCEDAGGVRMPDFPSLEVLKFEYMPEWEGWEVPHVDDGEGNGVGQQILFLPHLRELEIRSCPKLEELPPLSPTLESLEIHSAGLTRLPQVLGCHGGVGDGDHVSSSSSSPSLSSLIIRWCPNLRSLNDGLLQHPLPKLSNIDIKNCEELTCLPDGAFGHLASLKSLRIENCPKLSSLSSAREDGALPCSLEQVLILGDCGDMVEQLLPASIHKLTSLSKLEMNVGSLDTAELVLCGILQHKHQTATLKTLGIRKITRTPQTCSFSSSSSSNNPSPSPPSLPLPLPPPPPPLLTLLTSLTSLEILECSDLLLQVGSLLPSSLKRLSIDKDGHLNDRILSACLQGLTSLRSLSISSCPLVTSLPKTEVLCALDKLEIKCCEDLMSLGGAHTLISLQHLEIDDCPKLLHLVEAATSPSSSALPSPAPPPTVMMVMHPKSLEIGSSSVQQITMWLRQCSSLRTLVIYDCPQLTGFDDDGGDEIGRELEVALLNLASSLRTLNLLFCENLRSLPSKLRSLSFLETLSIVDCPQIQCLPVLGLPESLEELAIFGCPALKKRCQEGDPDGLLISHIPNVDIL